MYKEVNAEKAVARIPDGATIALGGAGAGHAVPDKILEALGEIYARTGHPKNLHVIHPCGIGEARAKEVVMLNQKIPADEAMRMGLLTRILKNGSEDKDLEVFLEHLAGLKPAAFGLAKRALMDGRRTTRGSDIDFDILAMQV